MSNGDVITTVYSKTSLDVEFLVLSSDTLVQLNISKRPAAKSTVSSSMETSIVNDDPVKDPDDFYASWYVENSALEEKRKRWLEDRRANRIEEDKKNWLAEFYAGDTTMIDDSSNSNGRFLGRKNSTDPNKVNCSGADASISQPKTEFAMTNKYSEAPNSTTSIDSLFGDTPSPGPIIVEGGDSGKITAEGKNAMAMNITVENRNPQQSKIDNQDSSLGGPSIITSVPNTTHPITTKRTETVESSIDAPLERLDALVKILQKTSSGGPVSEPKHISYGSGHRPGVPVSGQRPPLNDVATQKEITTIEVTNLKVNEAASPITDPRSTSSNTKVVDPDIEMLDNEGSLAGFSSGHLAGLKYPHSLPLTTTEFLKPPQGTPAIIEIRNPGLPPPSIELTKAMSIISQTENWKDSSIGSSVRDMDDGGEGKGKPTKGDVNLNNDIPRHTLPYGGRPSTHVQNDNVGVADGDGEGDDISWDESDDHESENDASSSSSPSSSDEDEDEETKARRKAAKAIAKATTRSERERKRRETKLKSKRAEGKEKDAHEGPAPDPISTPPDPTNTAGRRNAIVNEYPTILPPGGAAEGTVRNQDTNIIAPPSVEINVHMPFYDSFLDRRAQREIVAQPIPPRKSPSPPSPGSSPPPTTKKRPPKRGLYEETSDWVRPPKKRRTSAEEQFISQFTDPFAPIGPSGPPQPESPFSSPRRKDPPIEKEKKDRSRLGGRANVARITAPSGTNTLPVPPPPLSPPPPDPAGTKPSYSPPRVVLPPSQIVQPPPSPPSGTPPGDPEDPPKGKDTKSLPGAKDKEKEKDPKDPKKPPGEKKDPKDPKNPPREKKDPKDPKETPHGKEPPKIPPSGDPSSSSSATSSKPPPGGEKQKQKQKQKPNTSRTGKNPLSTSVSGPSGGATTTTTTTATTPTAPPPPTTRRTRRAQGPLMELDASGRPVTQEAAWAKRLRRKKSVGKGRGEREGGFGH
ncbi:MAG: hypothetical protein MMC33_004194 [Icmadophila ericetorum]|nr:hypothetical protein [Icmadophila ericetorum]